MIGIRVTNCWGESFYISSSIFPPLYMTAQWGHCVQFLSSFCAEIFIAGLSDFDLHMLCHRFTPSGQLNRQYIERAILSGQLKVHPKIQQTDLSLPESNILSGPIRVPAEISPRKQMEARSLITIRSDIKITLRQIVDQERIEAQSIEKQYQQKNTFDKSLAHLNHFATGLYTSGASFLTWMKDVNDVLSLNLRLLRIIQAAMDAENDNQGQRYQTFKQTLAESEKKELVEALGFDPAKISVDKLKQVYALANLIYDDHLTRIILTQFVKDYADAQHSLEWSEFSGGGAFEVILTALLAIATGGIGAIASLGAKAKKISQLTKLGALFSELAEILKNLPKDKQLSLRKLKEIEDKKGQKTQKPAPAKAAKQDEVDGTANSDDDRIRGKEVVSGSSAANSSLHAKHVDELATLNKQGLLDELGRSDIKHSPENIIDIRKSENGKIVFLETGNSHAGLEHILVRHKQDFANVGIHADQIPDAVMTAVTQGKVIGYQGKNQGRTIYDVVFNDTRHQISVTVSDNGFIVGANPQSRLSPYITE